MNTKIISAVIIAFIISGCKKESKQINSQSVQKSTSTIIENYFNNQINAVNKAKETVKQIEETEKEHFKTPEEDGK